MCSLRGSKTVWRANSRPPSTPAEAPWAPPLKTCPPPSTPTIMAAPPRRPRSHPCPPQVTSWPQGSEELAHAVIIISRPMSRTGPTTPLSRTDSARTVEEALFQTPTHKPLTSPMIPTSIRNCPHQRDMSCSRWRWWRPDHVAGPVAEWAAEPGPTTWTCKPCFLLPPLPGWWDVRLQPENQETHSHRFIREVGLTSITVFSIKTLSRSKRHYNLCNTVKGTSCKYFFFLVMFTITL